MMAQDIVKAATVDAVNGLRMVEQLDDPLHTVGTARDRSSQPKSSDEWLSLRIALSELAR
jgi:hypothetical protein